MLTLVEAARKTGLTTLAKAIRTGRLSVRRKENGSYEIDPAELAQVSSFPAPSAPPRLEPDSKVGNNRVGMQHEGPMIGGVR
jgi:hypothetical protein